MSRTPPDVIHYDYPLNERIRTFLRLEDLFARAAAFLRQDDCASHHAALMALFEITDVAGRADLKTDLLQEMERHRLALESWRDNPDVAEDALGSILGEIRGLSAHLLSLPGKIGCHLRDNDWLMSVKQRNLLPGGLCAFDLPAYHFWLNRDAETRRADLRQWLQPLSVIEAGSQLVLRLLRESGVRQRYTAAGGSWQQMLPGRSAHMLRVMLPQDAPCFPEISANRYAINIRFVAPGATPRPRTHDADVAFDLMLCNL